MDIYENVYMLQPQGFLNEEHPEHVCKLQRYLYGLKQVAKAWFHHLSSFLLHYGFVASKMNASLFIHSHNKVTLYATNICR